MRGKPKLTLVAQPQAFFRELLLEAMKSQRVQTLMETEFYLVNLLNEFMSADRLYAQDSQGVKKEEPLALMLKEALEEPQFKMQGLLFRHIGDISLYKAGFFPESLSRKMVDVDYYVEMGGNAYQQAALRVEEPAQRATFEELSGKFIQLVSVFSDVAENTFHRTEKDLIRLCDKWIATRSKKAAQALKRAGILPARILKKGSR